jgi:SAM-dependent methyltransferase
MGLKERIGGQCRRPKGTFGRMVARRMNRSHEGVTLWGLQFLDVSGGGRLLDIGCGGGRNLRNLTRIYPDSMVVGVDHSRDMVELSRQLNIETVRRGNLEVVEASVSRLPFSDASFNAITAVETHFFWPDLINDLIEVRRVLVPGGRLLVITEAYTHPDFEERNSEWEEMSGFRTDTPEELVGYLEGTGYVEVDHVERPDRNWLAAWGTCP